MYEYSSFYDLTQMEDTRVESTLYKKKVCYIFFVCEPDQLNFIYIQLEPNNGFDIFPCTHAGYMLRNLKKMNWTVGSVFVNLGLSYNDV